MKSIAGLWPQVVSWPNLVSAYKKCRRRKRFRQPACEFDYAWELELLRLQQEMMAGEYVPGAYRHFLIHEPKRRKISAAPFRDRVVHHAVVNVLEPIFERRFIFDSYACRKGKGTHLAIRRCQTFLNTQPYYLKTDVVRFFPNIDHEILQQYLHQRLRDQPLCKLIDAIIDSGRDVLKDEASQEFFPGDDLFALTRPRGLPIGNLTSQFFANIFLDPVDHFVKEQLRVPGYLRYSDDLILFGPSKRQLWDWHEALSDQLAGRRLRLHRHKTVVRPSSSGVTYLGFLITADSRRLTHDGIKRFQRRVRRLRWQYAHRQVSAETVRQSLRAWLGHSQHANSTAIRSILWRTLRFIREYRRPLGRSRKPS